MTELEKAAEAREVKACPYSTSDCLNTNYCHRCQWGVPSLNLRCSNNASFKAGAEWQSKQSPWISVEERLPDHVKSDMEQQTLWLRLGVSVSGTKDEIAALMDGDRDTLERIVAENRFVVDGDSYIPADSVASYNESYGADYSEEDISV